MARNSNTGCVVTFGLLAALASPFVVVGALANSKSAWDAIGLLLLVAVAIGFVVWSWTRS